MLLQLFQVPVVSERCAGVNKVQEQRGGVRVIYFNNSGYETWLLALYGKSERESIHELKKIRDAIYDR